MTFNLANLKICQESARRDDILDFLVPGDIRSMLGEIERLREENKSLRELFEAAIKDYNDELEKNKNKGVSP